MDITDSHAHLFMDDFAQDYQAVLNRARQADLKRIINIGLETTTNRVVLDAHKVTPGLHPALGWHPHEAGKLTSEDLAVLLSLSQSPEVVALGEIGLDYHYDPCAIGVQKKALASLLEMATMLQKPIVIHCREAWDDFFELLRPVRPKLKAVLLHCYSGGPAETGKALDLDCHFSYAGVITFAKADELRSTIPMVPKDRLLIETDAPYLAPVPRRGKRNEPALLIHHLNTLAEILKIYPDEAASLTTENAIRLFELKGPEL
jgi:TatD DNase family protein